MPRIVLHIGTHKTATTSLQRALFDARATLARRGILYPDYGLIGRPARSWHGAAATALAVGSGKDGDVTLDRAEAERFFRRVAERARDHELTILSAEPFWRHVAGGRQGEHVFPDRAAYWRRRTAYITGIRDLLTSPPVEVAVVFRDQAYYSQSLYQAQVKMTGTTQSFRDFTAAYWHHFDYLGQARAWATVFGKVRAMRFDDLVRDALLMRNFGELIGISLAGISAKRARNVGDGVDATILKRELNPLGEGAVRYDVMAFMKTLPPDIRAALWRRSFFDDPEHMRQFASQFTEDNTTLKSEFFPDLPPGVLFQNDYDTELAFGDKMDPRFLRLLLPKRTPRKLTLGTLIPRRFKVKRWLLLAFGWER